MNKFPREYLTCVGKCAILYVLFEEDIDFGKHLQEKSHTSDQLLSREFMENTFNKICELKTSEGYGQVTERGLFR